MLLIKQVVAGKTKTVLVVVMSNDYMCYQHCSFLCDFSFLVMNGLLINDFQISNSILKESK